MCGVCGIYQICTQKQPEQQQRIVQDMLAKMNHRGPDFQDKQQYLLEDRVCTLGHTRLAIIDLSELGNQPMSYKGVSLVFNGCIYNHRKLRQQLEKLGAQFKSHSDTEVIIHAYLNWGEDAFAYLQGMFSFVIFDANNKLLYAVRDRFGIKPLYYQYNKSQTVSSFSFASTTQALISQTETLNLDITALKFHFFVHGSVPAPFSILHGINKILPSHFVKIDMAGNLSIKKYWDLNSSKRKYLGHNYSEKDWLELIDFELNKAVKSHLLSSDVQVGVMLSGGLDSSLIAAIAQKYLQNNSLQSFSIGFDNLAQETGNEFYYSDLVSSKLATRHHKFHMKTSNVIDRLSGSFNKMSEPMSAQDATAFFLLSEQIAKYIKVVLSGQGADELFGGYFWYPELVSKYNNLKQSNSSALRSNIKLSKFELLANVYFDRDELDYKQMINQQYRSDYDLFEYYQQYFSDDIEADFGNEILDLDVTNLIIDDPVKRIDNMSMAFSLEARVPFLDSNLVELVSAIPSNLKLKHATSINGKYLLQQVAKKYLPQEIIQRKKEYFPLPALKIITGKLLGNIRNLLTNKHALSREIFSQKYINNLLENVTAESSFTKIGGSKLWHLAAFEMWLHNYFK